MPDKSRSGSFKMGATDPSIIRSQANKIKSASIEVNSNNRQSNRLFYSIDQGAYETEYLSPNSNESQTSNDCSFQQKAKKFLNLSPSSLKTSASTSCLFTATDSDTNTSNSLVAIPTRAALTHEWKRLKTPNKCRECNLLVYFNGKECSFCGFVAHKKCLTVLVIKCSGQEVSSAIFNKNRRETQSRLTDNAKQSNKYSTIEQQQRAKLNKSIIKPIFGQPINVDSYHAVDFIKRFISEIDQRGLNSKGIYRVSSIKSKVDRLCAYYDQNLSSLVDLSSFHPNIIANALKMYLRQLPEPLLTFELYDKFIDIAKSYPASTNSALTSSNKKQAPPSPSQLKHRKSLTYIGSPPLGTSGSNYNPMLIVELTEVIELLPPINRELVAMIMRHLRRVAEKCDENQMNAKNLSIIFGPTLLNADNKSLALVDNIHQARLTELMIVWANQIFPQYANYESKAVIEINLSTDYSGGLQQTNSKTRNSQGSIKEKNNIDMSRGIQEHDKSSRQKHKNKDTSKHKENVATTGPRAKQEQYIYLEPPPSPNTRNDLKELRRKFFTLPSEQNPSLDNASSRMRQPEFNDDESQNSSLNNPPVSVPVIKVQAYYCDTLKK